MDQSHIDVSDVTFQRRWEVLRSVDDMVERLVESLTAAGEMDNTYFIYSSDHGYHLVRVERWHVVQCVQR